jgi:hypothetical protein
MDRGMPWVRTNRRVGAAVALFGLAMQLVLSLGHVHLDKAALSSPAVAVISAAQAANGGDAPPDPDRRPGATDFCAICAALGLASSLVLPQPARLTAPVAHAHAWSRGLAAAQAASAPHLLFQARAPPRAFQLG